MGKMEWMGVNVFWWNEMLFDDCLCVDVWVEVIDFRWINCRCWYWIVLWNVGFFIRVKCVGNYDYFDDLLFRRSWDVVL